jgi:hypothetical protein
VLADVCTDRIGHRWTAIHRCRRTVEAVIGRNRRHRAVGIGLREQVAVVVVGISGKGRAGQAIFTLPTRWRDCAPSINFLRS